MASTNLGRVQGAGVFTTTAASGTSISSSTISPTNISPLVGDSVIFPNGDVRNVTAVSGGAITCGNVVTNIKGESGGGNSDRAIIYCGRLNTSTPTSFTLPDGFTTTNSVIELSISYTSYAPESSNGRVVGTKVRLNPATSTSTSVTTNISVPSGAYDESTYPSSFSVADYLPAILDYTGSINSISLRMGRASTLIVHMDGVEFTFQDWGAYPSDTYIILEAIKIKTA